MPGVKTIGIGINKGGTLTLLGRLVARDGSGAATGVDGEGNWVQQSDLSTINRYVYNLTRNKNTATQSDTLTVSAVILDTPVTTNVIWTGDSTGYNFIDDVPAAYFVYGNEKYRIEYKFTASGGAISWAIFEGTTEDLMAA